MTKSRDPGTPSVDARVPQSTPAPEIDGQPVPSHALLRGRKQVEIAHNGEVYRLQATRLGKLILTK